VFYDVFEINALISKYMLCEFEIPDVRMYVELLNGCHERQ